jgi:hypothetical protein
MMGVAARDKAPLSGPAAHLLDEHLAQCDGRRSIVTTMASLSDGRDHSSVPAVDTAAYALGREVARGGMGRILSARDLRIGRPVAVKELLRLGSATRFEREARVTARLQHPGIVPIYEIGRWPDGTPFYSMRMVETLGIVPIRQTTFSVAPTAAPVQRATVSFTPNSAMFQRAKLRDGCGRFATCASVLKMTDATE